MAPKQVFQLHLRPKITDSIHQKVSSLTVIHDRGHFLAAMLEPKPLGTPNETFRSDRKWRS